MEEQELERIFGLLPPTKGTVLENPPPPRPQLAGRATGPALVHAHIASQLETPETTVVVTGFYLPCEPR